jgi:hypothetical protein
VFQGNQAADFHASLSLSQLPFHVQQAQLQAASHLSRTCRIQQELLAFYAKVGLFAVQWMENEDPSRVATVGHEPVTPDMEISVAQVGRRAHEAPAQMQFPGLHKVIGGLQHVQAPPDIVPATWVEFSEIHRNQRASQGRLS